MSNTGASAVADRAGRVSPGAGSRLRPWATIPSARRAWPRWTKDDISRVRELAAYGFQSSQIASYVGRTPNAVSHKCTELGIRLPRQKHLGTAPADENLWDDSDRLSMFANIPHELAEFVVSTALHFNIDLKVLRSSLKTTEMVKCRNHIVEIARRSGYSLPVIGRALNRDPSTIRYAAGKMGVSPEPLVQEVREEA